MLLFAWIKARFAKKNANCSHKHGYRWRRDGAKLWNYTCSDCGHEWEGE